MCDPSLIDLISVTEKKCTRQATHCLVQVPAWRSVSYRAHRRHRWPDHETAHRLITPQQSAVQLWADRNVPSLWRVWLSPTDREGAKL